MQKSPSSHQPPTTNHQPYYYIATFFGTGHAPKASGTAGSLAALPFAFAIQYWGGSAALLAAAAVCFGVGWWAATQYLRMAPRLRGGDEHDPKEIVIDEVAGQWLLLAFMPLSWQGYALGFALFRLFDILKPWPVSLADRKIKGGLGVMLDDILAALYPVGVYMLLQWLGAFNG